MTSYQQKPHPLQVPPPARSAHFWKCCSGMVGGLRGGATEHKQCFAIRATEKHKTEIPFVHLRGRVREKSEQRAAVRDVTASGEGETFSEVSPSREGPMYLIAQTENL